MDEMHMLGYIVKMSAAEIEVKNIKKITRQSIFTHQMLKPEQSSIISCVSGIPEGQLLPHPG